MKPVILPNFPKKKNMKKELTAINLKKSTLFVFKSKKGKSGYYTDTIKTYTDPTNTSATSHTSGIAGYGAH